MTHTEIAAQLSGVEQGDSEVGWRQLANALGLAGRADPSRRWVQSPNAGHLSGLVWGSLKPEVVLVHDLGDSSNGWDGVALASTRDVVALDLPGHGRSSAAAAIASPARQAPALVDAIRSLAPTAALVVGSGLGAAIAVHAAFKRPPAVRALLVLDGGPLAAGATPLVDPDGFDNVDDAASRMQAVAPVRDVAFTRHLAEQTTTPNGSGRLEWRYQLGPAPDDIAAWCSFAHLGELPIPIAVATAGGEHPRDPAARGVLERWPDTRVHAIDAPAGDLAATAPRAVAAVIEHVLSELTTQ